MESASISSKLLDRRRLLAQAAALGVLLTAGWPRPLRAAAAPPPVDLQDITALIEAAIQRHGLDGVAAVALHHGQTLYRGYFGNIGPATPVPVASASKWVAGLLVMSFVAEGRLRLDLTLGEAGIAPNGTPAAAITLAQLMSHTSGLPTPGPWRLDRRYATPADAARAVPGLELSGAPGSVFAYGGLSMQVAGFLVEQAGGADWNSLFRRRIADPLGLSSACRWGEKWGIGGGLIATPEDYERILAMIMAKGLSPAGRRILPESAFAAMERNLSAGAKRLSLPDAAESLAGYGVGLWCETAASDGSCPIISSPGAFGTYPRIDRPRDLVILLVVKDQLRRLVADWRGVMTAMTAVADRRN
jgi:CubicO group peptidase (beta-lactamase class C family)